MKHTPRKREGKVSKEMQPVAEHLERTVLARLEERYTSALERSLSRLRLALRSDFQDVTEKVDQSARMLDSGLGELADVITAEQDACNTNAADAAARLAQVEKRLDDTDIALTDLKERATALERSIDATRAA